MDIWFVHEPLPPVTVNYIQFMSAPFKYYHFCIRKIAPKISPKCHLAYIILFLSYFEKNNDYYFNEDISLLCEDLVEIRGLLRYINTISVIPPKWSKQKQPHF